MGIYEVAPVSRTTGETESYDNALFPNVIRKRELQLLNIVLTAENPKFILDYGCGGGWLSIELKKLGFQFVGMDISKKMVKNAKIVCPDYDFIVCDALQLPFKKGLFDFVIGISILHHLDLHPAVRELNRVTLDHSTFLFMEPNLLNPLSAFGRKFFPMEAHTEGETPYIPQFFKKALSLTGLTVKECFSIFFLSFPVARLLKITGFKAPSFMVSLTYMFEKIMEQAPGLKNLNSTIVAVAQKW